MGFTCKYKGPQGILFVIFGGIWSLQSLGLAFFLFTFANSMAPYEKDNSLLWAPWILGPILFSTLIGLTILLLGVKRLRTPLLVVDEQGLRVGRLFKSYYFTWSELKSITHYTKNYMFGRRRPFFYRDYYDFLRIAPWRGEEVTLEISYTNMRTQELLERLSEFFPEVYTEN